MIIRTFTGPIPTPTVEFTNADQTFNWMIQQTLGQDGNFFTVLRDILNSNDITNSIALNFDPSNFTGIPSNSEGFNSYNAETGYAYDKLCSYTIGMTDTHKSFNIDIYQHPLEISSPTTLDYRLFTSANTSIMPTGLTAYQNNTPIQSSYYSYWYYGANPGPYKNHVSIFSPNITESFTLSGHFWLTKQGYSITNFTNYSPIYNAGFGFEKFSEDWCLWFLNGFPYHEGRGYSSQAIMHYSDNPHNISLSQSNKGANYIYFKTHHIDNSSDIKYFILNFIDFQYSENNKADSRVATADEYGFGQGYQYIDVSLLAQDNTIHAVHFPIFGTQQLSSNSDFDIVYPFIINNGYVADNIFYFTNAKKLPVGTIIWDNGCQYRVIYSYNSIHILFKIKEG